jgi:hypothetical protein
MTVNDNSAGFLESWGEFKKARTTGRDFPEKVRALSPCLNAGMILLCDSTGLRFAVSPTPERTWSLVQRTTDKENMIVRM